MANLLRLVACLFVLLSLNAYSATITTQVQKMSSVFGSFVGIGDSCETKPANCDPYTTDYSNDDLFYTFTATWDGTSILNVSVSDGSSALFTDGYYFDRYDSSGYYTGYSEDETVSISITDEQIISFQGTDTSVDNMLMGGGIFRSLNSTSWIYDGDQLIRYIYFEDLSLNTSWEDILTYDIINPSAIPLPAGIYLFLSGLVGLGLMRGRNG